MRPLRHLAASAFLALLAPRPALPCSVCACGDPLAAVAETPGNSGALRLALETEMLTVSSANRDLPGTTSELTQWTLRPSAIYSPLGRLNLVLIAPVTRKRMVATGMGMDATMSDESGLGDVELGARWFLFESVDFSARLRHSAAALAGSSFPTGPNSARRDGLRVDEHGQVGTGGFGPYLGAHYRIQGDVWSALATVTGRFRTENRYGYRYGQALLWSLQGQWQPAAPLAFSLGLDGRSAAADREPGAAVPNTGGLVLAATPAVHWNIVSDAWLFARAQLPFYRSLLGEQSVGPVFTAGIRYQAL